MGFRFRAAKRRASRRGTWSAKPKVSVSECRSDMNGRERGTRRPGRPVRAGRKEIDRRAVQDSGFRVRLCRDVQWAFSCRTVDAPHRRCTHSRTCTRDLDIRALDRTDSPMCACAAHDVCERVRIREKPRKARCYKGSAPSSIANIDLNHKDRPRYPIVGLRLIVCSFSLCLSFSLFLLYLQLSTCIARSVLSSFNGNDLSIHLFRTVYVPLVAFRPNAAVARANHTHDRRLICWFLWVHIILIC